MYDEGWQVIRSYLEALGVHYRVLIGDGVIAASYAGIEGLPITVMIDRNARIAARRVGLTTKETYEREIARLLPE